MGPGFESLKAHQHGFDSRTGHHLLFLERKSRQKELCTEPFVGQRKFLTVRRKFDRILAVEKDGKERKRYGSLLVEGSMKFSLLTFFFKRK